MHSNNITIFFKKRKKEKTRGKRKAWFCSCLKKKYNENCTEPPKRDKRKERERRERMKERYREREK